MKLGYIAGGSQGQSDLLLGVAAAALAERGIRLAGVVQQNTDFSDAGRCQMDLRVLVGDRVIRISQDLGVLSEGCRLDADGLERAAGLVEEALRPGGRDAPQLLVINKFGKQEAEGRGFRPAIGAALSSSIPVLTGVAPSMMDAFRQFSGDLAEPVEAQAEALVAWAVGAVQSADRH